MLLVFIIGAISFIQRICSSFWRMRHLQHSDIISPRQAKGIENKALIFSGNELWWSRFSRCIEEHEVTSGGDLRLLDWDESPANIHSEGEELTFMRWKLGGRGIHFNLPKCLISTVNRVYAGVRCLKQHQENRSNDTVWSAETIFVRNTNTIDHREAWSFSVLVVWVVYIISGRV